MEKETKVKELKSLNCTRDEKGTGKKRKTEQNPDVDETFRYAWFDYYRITGDVHHEFFLNVCVSHAGKLYAFIAFHFGQSINICICHHSLCILAMIFILQKGEMFREHT